MTDEQYEAFIAAGVARGLGFYQDEGFGLTKLDQSHCEYDDEITESTQPEFAFVEEIMTQARATSSFNLLYLLY